MRLFQGAGIFATLPFHRGSGLIRQEDDYDRHIYRCRGQEVSGQRQERGSRFRYAMQTPRTVHRSTDMAPKNPANTVYREPIQSIHGWGRDWDTAQRRMVGDLGWLANCQVKTRKRSRKQHRNSRLAALRCDAATKRFRPPGHAVFVDRRQTGAHPHDTEYV